MVAHLCCSVKKENMPSAVLVHQSGVSRKVRRIRMAIIMYLSGFSDLENFRYAFKLAVVVSERLGGEGRPWKA